MNTKRLAQTAVVNGAGTLAYTSPSGYRTELGYMNIANTTAGALSFTLHLVPVGGAAAAANMIFPAVVIAANTVVQWTGSHIMNAGDFLQAIGSAAGITLSISGNETRLGS